MKNLDRFEFRVFYPETKNMVYLKDETSGYDLPAIIEEARQGKCIIMQCTGLKDKNKNLIYEGDIINITFSSNISYLDTVQVEYDEKFYQFCAFNIDTINPIRYEIYTIKNHNPIIIGNIYENPELLK